MLQRVYTKNAAYQKFEVLKTNRNKRYRYYEFFVEGVRNINQAVQNGWEISSFLYDGEKPLSDWARGLLSSVPTQVNFALAPALMAELSGKADTSELMAVIKMRKDDPEALPLSENPLIVLFDRPSNKGNLGTIIRSCDAFGADALLLTGHGVDLYDADVISSTMGSFFNLPVARIAGNDALFDYIGALRSRFPGFQTIGTTAHRQQALAQVDFTRPTLLMIGNETDGLNRTLKESCDTLATIPMSGKSSAPSFNVGCAATVFLYEAIRQRL